MSSTPTEHADRSYREFARFARRVRRRAWTILFLRHWLRAAVLCIVLAAAVHVYGEIDLSLLAKVGALVSLVAAAILSFLGRRAVRGYVATVDRHYDAAGRIVAAAEFLQSDEPPDAFRKLAIEDAAEWISTHPRRTLPWVLRRARRRAIGVALCFAATMLVRCESPQPTVPQRRATEPDVAPPGLAQRPQQKETPTATTGGGKPQPERGDTAGAPGQKTADARPGEASTAPGETSQPGAGMQPVPTRSEDIAEGVVPKPAAAPSPEPVPEPPQENASAPEGAPQRDASDEPRAPESGPPGGQQAGTEEAEKKQDDREVSAPEDDVQAPEADDDTPGVGPEVEGVGEELLEEAARAPESQPVAPQDYRDARRQDLTRERVSPARRALIERYFRNLRAVDRQGSAGASPSRQPTRRPASQPASRPTSRPARKAEHS
jgi:hypothetical protein